MSEHIWEKHTRDGWSVCSNCGMIRNYDKDTSRCSTPAVTARENVSDLRTRLAAAERADKILRDTVAALMGLDDGRTCEASMEFMACAPDEVRSLRRARDELVRHYDAAGPEHNLLALLDLYHGRMTVAEGDAAAARAARDTALAVADRLRSALADIARPWPRLAEVPTNDPDAAEYLRMALMGEQRTAREALGLEDSDDA